MPVAVGAAGCRFAHLLPNAFGDPGGFGNNADLDVTVMAYAQWLSEMKQQANNARYHQQAELDLVRDAIGASNGELNEFKRHSTQVVQQLQAQVSELRAKLANVFAGIAEQNRQQNGLRDVVASQTTQMDTGRRTLAEQVDKLQADVVQVASGLRAMESEVENVRKALGSSQEQTVLKFGEVDQAMNVFHGSVGSVRQEIADTKQDWKRGQDLLGQAISTLSQDFADFQKQTSMVMNKLQSDVYNVETVGRSEKERLNRAEAQISGVAQNLYHTANEMILLKSERGAPSEVASQGGGVSGGECFQPEAPGPGQRRSSFGGGASAGPSPGPGQGNVHRMFSDNPAASPLPSPAGDIDGARTPVVRPPGPVMSAWKMGPARYPTAGSAPSQQPRSMSPSAISPPRDLHSAPPPRGASGSYVVIGGGASSPMRPPAPGTPGMPFPGSMALR